MPDGTVKPDTPLASLARTYGMLGYDLMVLTEADVHALDAAHVSMDASWLRPATEPRVVAKHVPDGDLAFIVFPAVSTSQTWQAVADVAAQARRSGKYNLVIGLSAWGADKETEFIQNHGKNLDLLFGAGDGPGYTGLYQHDSALLWIRSYAKGKGIHTVTLPSLPAPGAHVWNPGVTVVTAFAVLDQSVPDDPQIQSIFGP